MTDLKQYTNLQSASFQGWGYIHLNSNGYPGSEYPIGTGPFPAQTLADARTIAAARLIYNLVLHGGFVLDAAMQTYHFFGENLLIPGVEELDLNAQDVDNSSFTGLTVTGAQGGTGFVRYNRCLLNSVTSLRGSARDCELNGTLDIATGGATDYMDFINCRSYRDAAVTVEINASDMVNFFNFTGDLILDAMTAGTVNIWAGDGATITINASCTGGTINIYGNAVLTDNSGGATVNDYTVDAVLWNTHGIEAFPARALPANGVSLAEVLRYIAELKPDWDTPTSDTHTTTGTTEETILTTAETTPGLFYFDLDLVNMVAGDDFTIRVYKSVDGANYRLKSEQNFVDDQAIDIYEIEGLYLDSAQQIRVTLQRNSGTNRSFPFRYNILRQPVA